MSDKDISADAVPTQGTGDDARHIIAANKVKGLVRPMRQVELEQQAMLKAKGIGYEIVERPITDPETGDPITDPAGNQLMKRSLVITKVPEKVQRENSFFIESQKCFFPGCEGLRAQYRKDLEALGGEGCQSCQRGALMRRYLKLVQQAIARADAAKAMSGKISIGNNENEKDGLGHTWTGAVAGPAGGSQEGTVGRTPLLRRAAKCLAKVFGFGQGKEKDRK